MLGIDSARHSPTVDPPGHTVSHVSHPRSSPKVTSCPLSVVHNIVITSVSLSPSRVSTLSLNIRKMEKASPTVERQHPTLPLWASEKRTKSSWRTPLLSALALFALLAYINKPFDVHESPTTSHSSHKCPHQPNPLFPKIQWKMSQDEKDRSIDLFAQAVVSRPRYGPRDEAECAENTNREL